MNYKLKNRDTINARQRAYMRRRRGIKCARCEVFIRERPLYVRGLLPEYCSTCYPLAHKP